MRKVLGGVQSHKDGNLKVRYEKKQVVLQLVSRRSAEKSASEIHFCVFCPLACESVPFPFSYHLPNHEKIHLDFGYNEETVQVCDGFCWVVFR